MSYFLLGIQKADIKQEKYYKLKLITFKILEHIINI